METLRLTNPVLSNHPPWLKGEKASKRWITGWCFPLSPPPSLRQGGILLAHLRALSPPSTLDNRFARFEFAFLEDNPRTFRELSNYLSKFFIFDLLILFIFFFHRESGGKKCKGMWENSEGKMIVTCCVLDHMCERIWLKLNWGSEQMTSKTFGEIIFARERCG